MQKTYHGKEMPEINENDHKCSVIYALEIIGGKWKLPIIWKLSKKEYMRYNELKHELDGITNIMLTRSLNSLEEYGIVTRQEFDEVPPHVEYSLTIRGRELLPALEIFGAWGEVEMNKARDKEMCKND